MKDMKVKGKRRRKRRRKRENDVIVTVGKETRATPMQVFFLSGESPS